MKQLGIEMIAAYSPEARGRSERMFGTLQGRLPLELQAAGITTIKEANRFLKDVFLPEFNRRFSVEPQIAKSAFIPWIEGNIALDDILCIQDKRKVNNDNTISYKGRTLQIPGDEYRYSYRKTTVRVNEYLDGSIAIFHGPRKLVEFSAKAVEKEQVVDLWTSSLRSLAPEDIPVKDAGQPWKTGERSLNCVSLQI